jgi:hypothetical protein
MRSYPLLCLLFLTSLCHAQSNRFMFHLSANAISLPTAMEVAGYDEAGETPITEQKPLITLTHTASTRVGFNAGVKIDFTLGKRFFLTTGALTSLVRYQKNIVIDGYTGYLPTPVITGPDGFVGNGKTAMVYAQVPVMAGVSFFQYKLMARAGATLSALVRASESKYRFNQATGAREEYKDTDRAIYKSFLPGAVVDLTYFVTSKVGIDLTVNHSFASIYDDQLESKMTTFSLGVNYCLRP